MADMVKGSDSDDGIETTDLSNEKPAERVGPPWRLERAPELTLRGRVVERAVEMVTSVGCMLTTLAGLHFVFGVNLYVALGIAVVVPLLYGGVGSGGRVRVGMALRWRHRRRNGNGQLD